MRSNNFQTEYTGITGYLTSHRALRDHGGTSEMVDEAL